MPSVFGSKKKFIINNPRTTNTFSFMEPKLCYYASLITLLYGEMRNCSINNSWGQEGQVCNCLKNS